VIRGYLLDPAYFRPNESYACSVSLAGQVERNALSSPVRFRHHGAVVNVPPLCNRSACFRVLPT
jgi:hypothetical protein